MKSAFAEKIKTIRAILDLERADGFLISRCDNFAWLTFGGRSHITLNTTEGVASILVTQESVTLFSNNIEMRRLLEQEIPQAIQKDLHLEEFGWWEGEEGSIKPKIEGLKVLSDSGRYGTLRSSHLDPHRMMLKEPEWQVYRSLGIICDQVMSDAAHKIRPEMKEIDVQGMIWSALMERDIEPVLVLVCGEESAIRYRHNLPRDMVLGRKVFFSICARKRGLILSSTRSILFELDDDLVDQHSQNAWIDAIAIAYSRPGTTLGTVFERIQKAYEKAGYPGEWQKHHQGGIAGYNARERVASPTMHTPLVSGHAVAWNPTITGTKSEDTALILPACNEIVSFPEESRWPRLVFELNHEVVHRPDILVVR